MRTICIIQARTNSRRFPGKVLMDLCGKPMLIQQIRRLKRCTQLDEIVIATTRHSTDEPLVHLADEEHVGWFRGSEQDVLSRFVGAAKEFNAEVIVRITADCPLIDPDVTDLVIQELVSKPNEFDYGSNVQERTYPRGLDTEVFFLDTLLRMGRLADSECAREHVTILPRSERPDLFLCKSVTDDEDNSDLRWTVDTVADLELIRQLYRRLSLDSKHVPYREILSHIRLNTDLVGLNTGIETWTPA